MKFSCARLKFENAITLLSSAIASHSAKEILKCILVERGEENINLYATDCEIWIRFSLAVDGLEGDGSILLPADKLVGIARGEWSERLTINIENNVAEITTPTNKYRLSGYHNSDEFPKISASDSPAEAILSGKDLANAMQRTCFAAAQSDTRFAMNGVLFHIEKDLIEFVASDTHRLSLVRKKVLNKNQNKKEAIVINKGAAFIGKAAEGEEEITLYLGDREVRLESPHKTIVSRLVEGKFPKYQEVIPACPHMLLVARESLLRALRLLAGIAREEMKVVIIEICPSENKIILFSSDANANEGMTTLEAEIKGNPVKFGFNCNYLLDVLRVLSEEKVVLRYLDEKTAIRIDAEDFIHVIMPVRM
ncbi:MAG: DNA polymerase III subunit beta [Planctomycetota bacterium]|nr:DNA polymerase III subunit beta [Planctomycetota bacterium]